jgi:flagella basal body P-ring formation protein FlgA
MKKLPWILLTSLPFLFQSVAAEPITADSIPAEPIVTFNIHQILQKNLTDYVHQQVKSQLGYDNDSDITVEAASIDERIAIPECLEGFRFHLSPDALEKKQFSARIACESQNWFTYSSVALMFTQNVVVSKTTLSPNTVLRREHLKVEKVDVEQVRHTGFARVEDLLGATLKTRLRGGQTVQRRMLCYVCEGDRITIAARIGSMQVKTTGIAKEDGTLGDTIEVMNVRSKKIIFGEVLNAQEVVVSL